MMAGGCEAWFMLLVNLGRIAHARNLYSREAGS